MSRFRPGLVIRGVNNARVVGACLEHVAETYDTETTSKKLRGISRALGIHIEDYEGAGASPRKEFLLELPDSMGATSLGEALRLATRSHPNGSVRDAATILAEEYQRQREEYQQRYEGLLLPGEAA